MGMLDWMTGTKAAPKDVARQPVAALREALLAVNRPTAPFVVRDGAPEKCDLVAEWRIVDAAWYEIFAKAGLERAYKILMRFDEARGEVRAVDHELAVEWRAGVPTISAAKSAFRGQTWEMSSETAWAFREEDLSFGKVYQYRFVSEELKKPLRDAAQAAGWGWRGVAFGKL
ncbi:MAG: hypothetical protein K1X35_14920, partial [Caulobacteraceae bacterium]|nr:hypothetical protein [Caulobacteraceae bacterium]